MNRRTLLQTMALLPLLPAIRVLASSPEASSHMTDIAFEPLEHSHDYWRDKVSAQAWHILFEEGTEPAGSSPLDAVYDPGTYVCAACYLPLFQSDDKYDSKTGWPSFTQPIAGTMGTKRDFKLIWPRTEYHCVRCGGHQGHVFNDGPPPRGERWCNNGLALRFIPADQPLPDLRG